MRPAVTKTHPHKHNTQEIETLKLEVGNKERERLAEMMAARQAQDASLLALSDVEAFKRQVGLFCHIQGLFCRGCQTPCSLGRRGF